MKPRAPDDVIDVEPVQATAIAVRDAPTAVARPTFRPPPSTLEAWLSGRKPQTRRAYKKDLETFATFLGLSAAQALDAYFAFTGPEANAYVLDFRNKMVEAKLSGNTINRRLAALRSLAKVGRLTGRVVWTIDVDNVDAIPYRDTEGPGVAGLKKIRSELAKGRNASRNDAILALLQLNGLRRSEISELALEHVDFDKSRVSIMGKGRSDREWVPLSPACLGTLGKWIEERGRHPGSLFGLKDSGSIYRAIRKAGLKAQLKTSPHRVRHTAITRVLEKNGGDVRKAAAFARHRDLKVTQIYDDNRKNLAADGVALLNADWTEDD